MTQTQWLLLAVFLTGLLGFQRGWERALITSAIIAFATWFLLIGGDVWLAQLLTKWQALPALPTSQQVHAVAAPLYGSVLVLAYLAGSRLGMAPKTNGQRWVGIVPGTISGGAFLAYIGQQTAPLHAHNPLTPLFPLLFGVGVLLHLFFLFLAAKSH